MTDSSTAPASGEYFRIKQLAEGVYAAIVVPGRGAWGNAGIVDLGAQTLVFDSFATVAAAQTLHAAAVELTGRAPAWVVNSHNHADHIMGNLAFPEVTIVATAGTRDLIGVRAPAFVEYARTHPEELDSLEQELAREADPNKQRGLRVMLGEYRAIQRGLPDLQIRLPDLTFSDRLTFHGARRTAELITLGGGHTPSDAFLYLPADRVIFMGDLGQVGYHPSMSQGNPDTWIQVLDQVSALDVATVAPGHGPVGTPADLALLRQYIRDLQQMGADLRAMGIPVEELAQVPVPVAYQAWEYSNGFGDNLRFMYERAQP
jgi:glyoxylase-like metal-dependent hydrolase (beta-lactamase superfamily II)